jgi:hypothetical protein
VKALKVVTVVKMTKVVKVVKVGRWKDGDAAGEGGDCGEDDPQALKGQISVQLRDRPYTLGSGGRPAALA